MKRGTSTHELWNLYEAALQDPPYTVATVEEIYRQLFKGAPVNLREDFCGTFAVGREWIQGGKRRRAQGYDICEAAMTEAAKRNRSLLSSDELRRAELHEKDVRTVSRRKADIVLAENFSFFVFKTRRELLQYFKACYRSLERKGLTILDVVGGPLFTSTPHSERQTRHLSPPRPGLPKRVTVVRKHVRYDPLTAFGLYSFDFQADGKLIRNAFSYDWRIWTVPEIRECMLEAGFDEVKIFWDDEKSKLTLREITSIGSEWTTWLCLVVGVKR